MTYLALINPDSTDFKMANDGMKQYLRMSLEARTSYQRKDND